LKRRLFLSMLATATLDPERLLWTPGKKKIFIPPPGRPPYTLKVYALANGARLGIEEIDTGVRLWLRKLPAAPWEYATIRLKPPSFEMAG
jgi:hypothetical protein